MALREVMYIFYAVNAIRKIQNIKPPIVKVYQYLKRLDKNLEKSLNLLWKVLLKWLFCSARKSRGRISFSVKSFKDNLEHYKQCTPEDNTRTEIKEL